MRSKPMVYLSRLRRGEYVVLKPEPHRGILYASSLPEAFDKALAWCEAKRTEKAKPHGA